MIRTEIFSAFQKKKKKKMYQLRKPDRAGAITTKLRRGINFSEFPLFQLIFFFFFFIY